MTEYVVGRQRAYLSWHQTHSLFILPLQTPPNTHVISLQLEDSGAIQCIIGRTSRRTGLSCCQEHLLSAHRPYMWLLWHQRCGNGLERRSDDHYLHRSAGFCLIKSDSDNSDDWQTHHNLYLSIYLYNHVDWILWINQMNIINIYIECCIYWNIFNPFFLECSCTRR